MRIKLPDRPPQARFPLEDLPKKGPTLEFLRGGQSYFARESERVTREAAEYVGSFVRKLVAESKNPVQDRPRFTRFTLECVFSMFAEDAGIFFGREAPIDAMRKALLT